MSPIQGHAYIMQLQVMFIMKYPHYLQDWFHIQLVSGINKLSC